MNKKRSIKVDPGVLGMFFMSVLIGVMGIYVNDAIFMAVGAVFSVVSIIWGIIEYRSMNKSK